jgi:GNAT superfamily N-acetyltransferase
VQEWGSPYLAAQSAYLRHLGKARGTEVIETDAVYAVRTRAASNSENMVLSDSQRRIGPADVRRLIDWFREANVPASWLCAEGPCRTDAAALLVAEGCRPERSAREMQATLRSLDLQPTAVRADTRIELVTSDRRLEDWLDVAGACRWFESERERQALKDLYAGPGGSELWRMYVAFREETAVGMASAFYAHTTILLAGSAVLPRFRRQGIGRALALARLSEARERGCKLAVLGPSRDGEQLYRTLGFETHPQPADRWFYLPLGYASPSGS